MQHRWNIDARQYQRHETRRGRRYAFEDIDPTRTALVVIDMIPFFVDSNPYARAIVPVVARLAKRMRSAGGAVCWAVPADLEADARSIEFYGREVAESYAQSGGGGSPHDRLWPGLEAADNDLIVEKRYPGAFFPGSSRLRARLQDRGVDTVIVAGTVANVCCESTVREAATLGYRAIMVADGNAAASDEELNATLHTVYRSFGDVRTAAEIEQLLGNGIAPV